MIKSSARQFGVMLGITAFLSGLSFSQTITVSPTQLTFNVPPGILNSSGQPVTVTPSANNTPISFAVNNIGAPWLRVNNTNSGVLPNVSTAGTVLSVSVDTLGLTTGQIYNGYFTVQVTNVPSTQQIVGVTLFVGGSSSLFAAPSSLTFTAIQGASVGTPSSQNVTISSTAGPLAFMLSSQVLNGANWLSVSSTGGTAGDPTTGTFSVSVIPSGLGVGTYTATITAQSTTTADLVQIPVTLNVTGGSSLKVSPSTLPAFIYQIGSTLPAPESVVVTSNGSPISFSVAQSPSTASWLVVNPQSGTADQNGVAISLSLNQPGIPSSPGTYTTSLVITPSSGAAPAPIPVTLVVTNNPILTAMPSTLAFTAAFAGINPNDQVVNLTAPGAGAGFTLTSDSPWLTFSASSTTTPSTVIVHVSTNGLPVGSYTGVLSLRPTNGDNYTIPITVTLTIVNPRQITAAPSALLFSYQLGMAAPAAQTFLVQSPSLPVQFTGATSTSSCGNGWLVATASQNTTPATVTVQPFVGTFSPGVCTGSVILSFGVGTQPLVVPVAVVISNTPLLSISQPTPFGNEVVTQGAPNSSVISRTISLTSTDPNSQVTFSAFAGGAGWLTIGPGTGVTPQNLVVSITPGGLSPGVYTGQILIGSPSLSALPGSQVVLPVTLTVNPNVTVTVSPTALNFTEAQGGTTANQSLNLSSSGGTGSFTATVNAITGGSWLDVNPKSGNATGALTVSIKPNSLPASSSPYTAQIVLAFPNSSAPSITVPVSLTVTNASAITVSAQSLTFGYQVGGAQPVPQKITVSNAAGPVPFTVATTSTPGGWLSVDASSGTTPKDINVSVSPGLAAGTYHGSISILPAGSSTPAQTINVTLTVSAIQMPVVTTVTSNASNVAGPIVAGEIITLKGTNLGPVSPPNNGLFSVTGQNTVSSTLDGVQVLFGGVPGTPIYVSANQINVTVPWEINGQVSTNVVVMYNGASSAPVTVQLATAGVAPAFYTVNSTGSGQAAAVNQDGSFNGPSGTAGSKPASANTVISLYGTGGGLTSPAGTTGSVSPSNQLLKIAGSVSATIGGAPATVQFIGAAPGLVTGVMQVNLVVPTGVSGSNLPVILTINGVSTQTGVTVAVQ